MTQKQTNQAQPAGPQQAPATGQAATKPADDLVMAGADPAKPLLPAKDLPPCETHCVDVTGRAPEDIRVDPDITEGHPGYQESGDSELIPPDRLAGKNTAGANDQGG